MVCGTGRWGSLGRLCRVMLSKRDIVRSAEQILGTLDQRGGIFHLWGHSWEIEEHGLWATLDELLRMLASRRGFVYATNGEVLGLLNGQAHPLPMPAAESIARSA